ncbi:putative chemosensory ionotropic receptor IR68a, partial [Operophtera brumata]
GGYFSGDQGLLLRDGILSLCSDLSPDAVPLPLHERRDMEFLLIDVLNEVTRRHSDDVTCAAIICDPVYLNIVVEEREDLLSPNFITLESLREVRRAGCNVYVILLANGFQASRLLRFGDRILDTRAKFVLLHDFRLFHSELHYLWKRIVNVGVLVTRRVDIWRNGKFHYSRALFKDKTSNLNGETLNVVYLDHVPSVVALKDNATNKIGGVEIEILNTLSEKMNFKPKLYQPPNADLHKWGGKQPNGSFSGLLGEMVSGRADVALGNLQYNPYHLELTDLSIPYTSQCWTFVTPEALTDNSWKTLILPFNILYTYGMLLVISLPKLPTGWSIRLLTGWYWLYCILLVVSYRASMTAILANPAPRVTIDTLKELVDSKVICSGWGSETKAFFINSLDEIGQKIGERFETIDDPIEAANRVAQGTYAYYDNKDFLKYLSVKRKNAFFMNSVNNSTNTSTIVTNDSERNLHIMSDCMVHIPISIGFHKNSPLKPLADIYMRRVVEVGLAEKWLNDAMYPIRSLETNEEEIKALMNLKKLYGAFIALAIGYTLSFISLIGELFYWKYIVKRDPNFDKFTIDLYYTMKNKKQ